MSLETARTLLQDAVDVQALRENEKAVRFCPSCGYRRVHGKALHWWCSVCLFAFSVVEARRISSYRCNRSDAGEAEFEITARLDVPVGREGVAPLVADVGETKQSEDSPDLFGGV